MTTDISEKNKIIVLQTEFEELKTEVEKLRTELAMLVLERDDFLYQECKNIEMAYMLSVGALEYKAHEIECAVLRLKRKAELIQAKKNRQEKVILADIEAALDVEYAEYKVKLEEQIARMNAALDRSKGTMLTEEETREMKKLYRTIIKNLHPDLHPELGDTELDLFHNAVFAYEHGDLERLRIINLMVSEPAMPDPGSDKLSFMAKEKERLIILLDSVKDDIEKIKSEYPYTMKTLVQSPAQIEARKAELEEDIKRLDVALAAYASRIEELLR